MRWNSFFRNRENRLYFKILFYFLTLLIPIVIIGLSTYMYSLYIMKKDFNDRIKTNLQNAAQTIDAKMGSLQEISFNFFSDYTVRMLLMPEEQQSLEVRTEIWRLPKIIQRNENIVSDFTDRMFVYIDTSNVYVSAGVNRFDSFFGTMYKYDQYDADYWAQKLNSDKYIELLPAASVKREGIYDKQVVPVVIRDRLQSYNAVMVINVAVDAIEKALKGNAVFESTRYVITDGSGKALLDPNGYMADPLFAEAAADRQGDQALKGEMDIAGERYEVSHAKSALYGWDYYSFTPISEFHRHTSSILLMTLLLCLVLVLMGIVFSFVFSSRIYNPIRNIRNIILDKSDLWSHEGHAPAQQVNDFEQIQQSLRSLTDYHRQYKRKYDQHTSEYVESSFLFLLKGHTLNQEEILQETLQAEFGLDRAGYVCCGVSFDFKEPFYQDIQDTDRMLVMNGIKKIIWTLLGEIAPSYVIEYRQNLFVAIINVENREQAAALHPTFQKLMSLFQYDIHMYYDMTVGIGTFYSGINEIGASYNEAMTAIGKRSGKDRFQIVDSEQLQIENRFMYSLFDEQKIWNHLKLGHKDALRDIIDQIVTANVQGSISYEYLGLLFQEMYTTGARFLVERGMDVHSIAADEKLSRLLEGERSVSFSEYRDMQEAIYAYYVQIIDATRTGGDGKSGSLVSLIEKYIEDNYRQDLGLEQIAGEMGVSLKYVSRVFKEKTGVNLTDYINQVRMDKAKKLLTETDMRVSDIAEQIGIPSRTTFLRVFKKMEGIAPNDYRSLHRK
ncbi:helix-turn-helix domain-containing protein [Paenibacillus doosanensis]|uniref:helix-turn-helix domain-containing protein n=1 Tax=Paenibacillus doosanensis TaxID=1229154 RepID=UPI00217FC890|nr:helix-turn-helix domain-containing protein [Paenibacillus doosanensis]MCS7461411.1 helix-turn-helix domain-containing protein [Paenibacillus doosanensis]